MKVRASVLFLCIVTALGANETVDRAHQFEDKGDSTAARDVYAKAIKAAPKDAETLTGYAEFLERYHDSGARAVYRKSAEAWKAEGKTDAAAASARQAVLLDLVAGDRKA